MRWASIFLLSILFSLVMLLSCQKELSCEGCYVAGNKAPIANAGADTTVILPADSAVLDSRSSYDPDGTIETYRWRQIQGPGIAAMSNPSAAFTLVNNMTAGIYLFEITVTDNGGLPAKDTVQVSVISGGQSNRPPIANAGPDQEVSLSSNQVTLDGRASTDPDNNIVSFSWTKISGPNTYQILSANASTSLLSNLLEGSYFFQLRVVDAGGLSSTDTVRLRVNPQPSTPGASVSAGPDIIITLPLDSVYLEGKWFGVQNAAFQWTKISGPSGGSISTVNMLNAGMAVTTNLIPGLYTFAFSLQGMADTMTVSVVDDPAERNTITFKNLQWRLVDEYGIGVLDLDIMAPAQPNLFSAWNQLLPSVVSLQVDQLMPWVELPITDPFATFTYDFASPRIWVMRLPNDRGWVGRESSLKVKIL